MLFKTILKISIILSISFVISNCAGNHQNELEKLDKIYGYCDNPQRNIRGVKYDTCKAKERAQGPSGKSDAKEPLSISELLNPLKDIGNTSLLTMQSSVNKSLWQASLNTLSKYDLKIADYQAGFIQTEWIYYSGKQNLRCKIKIQINSPDIISTAVQSFFICEDKIDEVWILADEDYSNEEKKLTLTILQKAVEISEKQI